MLRPAVLNVQNVSTARGKGCWRQHWAFNGGQLAGTNLQAEGCSELAEMADKAIEETGMTWNVNKEPCSTKDQKQQTKRDINISLAVCFTCYIQVWINLSDLDLQQACRLVLVNSTSINFDFLFSSWSHTVEIALNCVPRIYFWSATCDFANLEWTSKTSIWERQSLAHACSELGEGLLPDLGVWI